MVFKMSKARSTKSSGNVFADIGIPNAQEYLAKADRIIQERKMRKRPAAYHTPEGEADRLRLIIEMYRNDPVAVANAKAALERHLREHFEKDPFGASFRERI